MDATQSLVLEWLVSGLVFILLAIIGFAARRWFNHVDSLQVSMQQLRDAMLSLSDKFVTQAQHERDMESIRSLGRRITDRCGDPNCPYEHTAAK